MLTRLRRRVVPVEFVRFRRRLAAAATSLYRRESVFQEALQIIYSKSKELPEPVLEIAA